MNELVSAVVTTYKREPEIVKRALDSVVSQTYRPLEIIVVDDSPQDYNLRDDVKKLIETYEEDIYYIQHETNSGACAARNTGLKLSHGKYIAFLDDDDEWIKDKIEKQVDAFRSDDIVFVYCPIWSVDDTTGKRKLRYTKFYEGYIYPQLMYSNFVGSTSFPLIRKKTLEDIGGFDLLMPASQDYDVWIRLAQKHKVACIAEPLGIYHWHDGEQISKDPKKKIIARERIYEKNIDYINKDRRVRWHRMVYSTPEYAKNMQLGKALSVWSKAVTLCPLNIYTNIRYLWRTIKAYISALSARKG